MLEVGLLSVLEDSLGLLFIYFENRILLVDSLKNHALENLQFVMKSLLKVYIFDLLFFNELRVFVISTVFGSLSIRELNLNVLAISFGGLRFFWLKLQKSP